jgi:hypothetical protein
MGGNMKKYTTRYQNKKKQYRISNWREYNQALVERGSLIFWVSEDAITNWLSMEKTGKRGKPIVYGPIAIQSTLTLQALFHLPLRQTEGLVNSIFRLSGIQLPSPDYTTISKRRETLSVDLARHLSGKKIKHLVVDSTGVKVYGEGEWKVRQHGKSKRRTWRKIHIGLDSDTGEITVAKATPNSKHDSEVLPELLGALPLTIEQVAGDGMYDTLNCYEAIKQKGAYPAIPPKVNAKILIHGNTPGPPHPRDENLRRIRKIGRKSWKIECGYNLRSLAETAVFRLKTIFGDKVSARKFTGQTVQLMIRCRALNQMLSLGMPNSYVVA